MARGYKLLNIAQACEILRQQKAFRGVGDRQIMAGLGRFVSAHAEKFDVSQALIFIRLTDKDKYPADFSLAESEVAEVSFPTADNKVLSITIVDGSRYTGDRKGAIAGCEAEDIACKIYSEGVSDTSALPKACYANLLREPRNPSERYFKVLESLC